MRKALIAIGVVVALLVGAVVALILTIDASHFAGVIEARAEESLGREVTLGELGLSFWPFGVQVDGFEIGGREGEGADPLLVADSVTVGARLLPLLSKRLEVKAITVQAPRLEVVRGTDGTWNLEHLLADSPAASEPAPTTESGANLIVRDLRVSDGTVVIRDASTPGGAASAWTLEDVDLEVEEVASTEPFDFTLSARLAQRETRFSLSGRGGPLAQLTSGAPIDATAEVSDLPLAELSRLVGGGPVAVASGMANLRAEVEGAWSSTLAVDGQLDVENGAVTVRGSDGQTREVPLELEATFDTAVLGGGSELVLNEVAVKLDDHAFALRGSVRGLDDVPTVDLTLSPVSLPAEAVAKLMSLAGIPSPVAFSSEDPIEVEASVRGPVGEGATPALNARARLRGFTLTHPSLAEPVKNAGATLALAGERIEVNDLTAVIGSSDVAGSMTIEGFTAPEAQFALRSRRADFDELFSFLVEEPSGGSAGAGSADGGVDALTMRGSLDIESGRFATLEFADLDSTVSFSRGTLALDPVAARLYGGAFRGAITTRLVEDPPPFTIDGTVETLDVGTFLRENLGQDPILDGRLTGRIAVNGAGTELEQVLPRLAGMASIDVREGRVGQLNVLNTLAGVANLLGQSSLERLSSELASDGTPFQELSAGLRMDSGRLFLDDLAVGAKDFRLAGDASVDLQAATLDGAFRLAFSPAVSAALQAEDSLAAKLFWKSSSNRVELPFTLSGPWSRPHPGVDLSGAVRERVGDELRDRLTEELRDRLGGSREPDRPTAPPATTPSPSGPATAAPSAPAARTHESLAVALTGSRWRGPILARDLELSGTASGVNLARVSLVVTDGEGRTLETIDRLADVQRWVESTPDRSTQATVTWKVKIDGERLVLGRSPFTVTVSAFNDAGESAAASFPVDR